MRCISIFSITLLFVIVYSCTSNNGANNEDSLGQKKLVEKDLGQIKKEGTLRVSTTYSGTSYFLYKGQTMGFQYELLKRFADYLDVNLEIVIANNIDSLIPNLNSGVVDLVAHDLTITQERKELVSFSDYIYLSRQVLVQRKPYNWRKMKLHQIKATLIKDAIELEGETISVRQETSFIERLKNLEKEIGGKIYIDTLDGALTADTIVQLVVDGEVNYTILDDNVANIYAANYPDIDISVPVSFSQKIAWATRHTSPELLDALNKWLNEFKKTVDYHTIYNKYFKNKRAFRKRVKSEFYSLNSNAISEYDAIIKENADKINWDWRLVASVIYQESGFDPKAVSWAGAGGLMQIMPETARELNLKNPHRADESIYAGTQYLYTLWKRFDVVKDPDDRIKFALASYNCGYAHVVDAQNLAVKKNLDSTKWDGNVAEVLLSLSSPKNYNDPVVKYGYTRGIEPYLYVQQIFERYAHYKEFIKEE